MHVQSNMQYGRDICVYEYTHFGFHSEKKLYNMVKWEWELMNEIDCTGIKLDKIYCTKVIPEKREHFTYFMVYVTKLNYFLQVVSEFWQEILRFYLQKNVKTAYKRCQKTVSTHQFFSS